jgi:hypothetical protein
MYMYMAKIAVLDSGRRIRLWQHNLTSPRGQNFMGCAVRTSSYLGPLDWKDGFSWDA